MKKSLSSKIILFTLVLCMALASFPISLGQTTESTTQTTDQTESTQNVTTESTKQETEKTQKQTVENTAVETAAQIQPQSAPVIPPYTGSSHNPHPITNKYELASIGNAEFGREYPLNGNYIQAQDIVFDEADFKEGGDFYNDGKGWKPIGITEKTPFSGTYDGGNHAIKNININRANENYIGIFSFGNLNTVIKNLENTNGIIIGKNYVAGFICKNAKKIDNCINNSKIIATDGHAVGIVMEADHVSNCVNLETIIGKGPNSWVFGIVYRAKKVEKCKNFGNIESEGFAAGICCGESFRIEIINCYNSGKITGTYNVAGISLYAKNISESFNMATITSEKVFAAGIVASTYKQMKNCFNYGDIISGGTAVGLTNSIYSSNNEDTIENCYNRGEIISEAYAASGLIEHTSNKTSIFIKNSYNASRVTAAKQAGNDIIYNLLKVKYSNISDNTFYDLNISDSGYANSENKITEAGLSTTQMTGLNALDNMPGLNDDNAYEPYEFGYPELKVFKYSDDPFVRMMSKKSVHVGEWIDEVAATGVTLNENNKTLKTEETFQLTATVAPDNATNKNVTWSSSDENIATVDENGNIKAIAKGTVTITVTTADGGHTATCNVTVEETQQGEKIFINDTDSRIIYNGTWNHKTDKTGSYKNDDHGSDKKNDSFEIPFHGTQIKWFGPKTPNSGKADVYIDDVKIETVDCYNADRLLTQMLFDSGVLADGQHTLKVVVTGTKNASAKMTYINADAFEIMETQPKDPQTIINDNEMGFTNGKISYGWNSHAQTGAYNDDESYTNTAGMMFMVPFEGSQIKWHGAYNNTCGKADVYIDDVLVKTVDCYKAIREDDAVLFDSGTLAKGQHTMKVVLRDDRNPASSNNYITVDRITFR